MLTFQKISMENTSKELIRSAIESVIVEMLWGESDSMDPYMDRKYVMENLFMVIVDEDYGGNNLSMDQFIDCVLERIETLGD